MSDLVRKEIHGIFGTKTPTEKQIRKYKRSEKELDKESNSCSKYVRSDFMLRLIKNCRGDKNRGDKIDNFRIKLGFKMHEITISKEELITTNISKIFAKEKNFIPT